MRILQGLEPAGPPPVLVRQRFLETGKNITANHARPLGSVSNYFHGSDQASWRTGIPHYAEVEFQGLYQGIGIAYYGSGSHLEYDLRVQSGADARQIGMLFEGADSVALNQEGELVLSTQAGKLIHSRPLGYQWNGSRRIPVPVRYRMEGDRVSFDIGEYDRSKALVIDPVITFASYWGGSGTDYFLNIGVDAAGAMYAGGDSDSVDVPLINSYLPNQPGFDIAVLKVSSAGSLVYSSFIGGSSADTLSGLALDHLGAVYVTGVSSSPDFPVVNPYQTSPGVPAAILFKLGPIGNTLSYSTFLYASPGVSAPVEVQVDATGAAYVGGITSSPNFPVVGAFQSVHGNLGSTSNFDAFVTKFNPSGSQLVYSTYLGGSGNDVTWDIAIDQSGAVCITGQTQSANFPTRNAVQATRNGPDWDAFVARLNPQGNELVYSTYLGGSGSDIGRAIACDSTGAAYMTGSTESSDYPVLNPFQTNLPGIDAMVTKLTPAGALSFSTYLGGTVSTNPPGTTLQSGEGIAVGSDGSTYVIGTTFSDDFPVVNPLGPSILPASFVSRFTPAGDQLSFSSFLPLTQSDIAVDAAGTIYLTAGTYEQAIPTVNPLQPFRGQTEMFITRISQVPLAFDKDACKNGGWQQLRRADGSAFKNQGDCIQYANTGK